MDIPGPSTVVCQKSDCNIRDDERHPWSCIYQACIPVSKDVIHHYPPGEEPSVHKGGGDEASVAESGGLQALLEVINTSESDDGRRIECGRFYTHSPPDSGENSSVHLSRHYFMLDG
jgi:hypothetical protein